jgi:hypothetical protein
MESQTYLVDGSIEAGVQVWSQDDMRHISRT